MLIKQGIPVSPGIAIGRVFILEAEDVPVARRLVEADKVDAELARLHSALEKSIAAIEQQRAEAEKRMGADLAGVFSFHAHMLQDKYLVNQFEQLIERERVSAEYAIYTVMRKQAKTFREMDNRVFRERVTDIWDVERRVLGHLIGKMSEKLEQLRNEAILVAHDLTPSQTATLDKSKIKAIVTDLGGRTSHSAIMAHALGIPAVVGLEDATQLLATGDQAIIDGHSGHLVLSPDAATLMDYRSRAKRLELAEISVTEEAQLPAVTLDGVSITTLANIEFPSEVATAINKGGTGIGLYRTEFLFLSADVEPSEESQYETYVETIRLLKGKPLTVRTFDLGADKAGLGENTGNDSTERNPFLGCRSIRLCLQNLPLFNAQLRAILRASVEGPVRIMFPLISNIMELRQARMIVNDVMEDLEESDTPYDRNIRIGIMIEVPSAALQARALAKEVDFFSIGTNDLIQYTVAVDRSNERIASLYSGAHPAVIKLIREVIAAAKHQKIDLSICGEIAGDPEFTMLLIGLGLRTLSITPPAIPEVKRVIRNVSIESCERIARKVRNLTSDREILNYLRAELRKVVPSEFD